MPTQTEIANITEGEALAKAVEYALEADRLITDDIYNRSHDQAAVHAVISQAFTALAEAIASRSPRVPPAVEPEPRRRPWLPARRAKRA
ncbi:hypothetical protein ACFYPN_33150 [Streptomyces sp. NPDC005576]|uniref:hypothetical protein n=1 Tax=Streptomyces sp. NPDC005576 TaxID=3364726 RepID=UPI00368909EA